MKSIKRQLGVTLTGLIIGCIVIGGVALTGMKLFPLYNEKFKTDQALENLARTPEASRMKKMTIAKTIQKQFDVSDAVSFENEHHVLKAIKVEKKKGSPNKLVTLAFEIRRPFFAELDIVMNYKKTVELPSTRTD